MEPTRQMPRNYGHTDLRKLMLESDYSHDSRYANDDVKKTVEKVEREAKKRELTQKYETYKGGQ